MARSQSTIELRRKPVSSEWEITAEREGSNLGCYFLGAADVASEAIALSAPVML